MKINKFALILFLIGILLLSSAYAFRYKTVVILNDAFISFAIHSDFDPYWINDSEIVHKGGRIELENDGKYILSNAKSYYDIMYRTHRDRLDEAWRKKYGGDFGKDMVEYYDSRVLTNSPVNASYYFNLKQYWEGKKAEVFGEK